MSGVCPDSRAVDKLELLRRRNTASFHDRGSVCHPKYYDKAGVRPWLVPPIKDGLTNVPLPRFAICSRKDLSRESGKSLLIIAYSSSAEHYRNRAYCERDTGKNRCNR